MIELHPSTYYYKPKISREIKEQSDADLRDKIAWQQADCLRWGYTGR